MKIIDHSEEVTKKLHEALYEACKILGGMIETNRKKNITEFKWQHKTPNSAGETYHAAIDTGLLRNSITYAISGKEANMKSYKADRGGGSGVYAGTAPKEGDEIAVYVGTNVEYAEYIETGTSKIPAVHFLSDAVNEHKDQYKKVIEKTIASKMK